MLPPPPGYYYRLEKRGDDKGSSTMHILNVRPPRMITGTQIPHEQLRISGRSLESRWPKKKSSFKRGVQQLQDEGSRRRKGSTFPGHELPTAGGSAIAMESLRASVAGTQEV